MNNPFDQKRTKINALKKDIEIEIKNHYHMLTFMVIFKMPNGSTNMKYMNMVLLVDSFNIPLLKMNYCQNNIHEQMIASGVREEDMIDIVCMNISYMGCMTHDVFTEGMDKDDIPASNLIN